MGQDENQTYVDLFGETVYAVRRKRGRPPFEWTVENSNKVKMLLALGWVGERIAAAVIDPRTGKSISLPTLKRYFRAELSERDKQRDRLMAHQIMVTADAAFSGNVGALRLLTQLIEKNDLMEMQRKVAENGRASGEEKKEPIGKKEKARLDASKIAGGEASSAWGNDLNPDIH